MNLTISIFVSFSNFLGVYVLCDLLLIFFIRLVGKSSNFSAGADIREFGEMSSGSSNDDIEDGVSVSGLCDAFEVSTKPVVAAVRGVALGGG